MRILTNLPGRLACLILILTTASCFADALLMTLSVESTHIQWQDEFVLTLEIYGSPTATPPVVTIDGLDQFQLKGMGRNLLQVPLGKTAKWILTYNVTAQQDGTFKLGPAAATVNGRRFLSNTLFITVEAPTQPAPRPAPTTPLIHSTAEIGERVKVVMEAPRYKIYRGEGVPVTLRLLSQLPVENLRFEDEAAFPGFVKYDFPFSTQPKAQWVTIDKEKFASYELQKFLVFPLKEGKLYVPPVRCGLKVRSPSGAYEAADLVLDVERSSNSASFNVEPAPTGALVGSFMIKSQILSDAPRAKVIRLIVEGEGQLTTFDFPALSGAGYSNRIVDSATTSKIQGEALRSRKSMDVEILPLGSTTSIVLPPVLLKQFDPRTATSSALMLPGIPLRFLPPQVVRKPAPPAPISSDTGMPALLYLLAGATLLFLLQSLRPAGAGKKRLRLSRHLHGKKASLQISKSAAQAIYRKLSLELSGSDEKSILLMNVLKRHLPETEWMHAFRTFKRLEATAFSSFRREQPITYGELKRTCRRVETQWQN